MAKNGTKLTNNTPSLGAKPLISQAQNKSIREDKLSFSFSHFKQIDNFGIGNCSTKWHTSLLERMAILGKMTLQEILDENKGSKSLRCHCIDWSTKNIPIQRSDLDWLPSNILNNEDEFPIMQISVSTATGRIIGYFDKNSSVFNVILLDPEHNIQPAKYDNYQIQPTTRGISQYDDLLNKIVIFEHNINKCKSAPSCPIIPHIDHSKEEHNIIYVSLDNDFYATYREQLKEHSIKEILEAGIICLE